MIAEMINYLENLDRVWFLLVNRDLTNSYLDGFFATITNLHHQDLFLYVGIPIIFFYCWWKFRGRAIKVALLLGLVAGLSDTLSYRVIKPYFQRPRPKNTLGTQVKVRVPYYPKSYSFPSNHAFTGFALARTLAWLFPMGSPWYWGVAALVAYSRVYVGVHYPGDVFGGALLGYLLASLLIRLFFARLPMISSLSSGPKRVRHHR